MGSEEGNALSKEEGAGKPDPKKRKQKGKGRLWTCRATVKRQRKSAKEGDAGWG